jgi:putative FmdB family regulatory protein
MPTYEYECLETGKRFEVLQKMSEEPLEACPECGADLRRIISGGAGAVFRGKGFHCTDSRSSSTTCCGRDTPCETPPCER